MGLFGAKLEAHIEHVTEGTLGCRIKSKSRILKEAEKPLLALLVSDMSLNSREIISGKVGAIFKRADEMTWISIS